MERRLAAVFAADVVGYSRLIRIDEEGTIETLRALDKHLIAPMIDARRGRIVKRMGDGILAEFASVVDAVACGAEVQQAMAQRNADAPEVSRIDVRIGINLGDVVIDGEDIHGDGVNVAARLEALSLPGGMCISDSVHEQVRDRLRLTFDDLGERNLKNIDRPLRAWSWQFLGASSKPRTDVLGSGLSLPERPSIAVLPFDNLSSDPEQEHFADGISEDIITALSKIPKLFVVARNSTFTYKGRAVDVTQVGREQGVRYVLEGSVRRSAERVRITAQLIDATTGGHIWAQRYDRIIRDIFDLQDEITREVASALQVELTEGDQARIWANGTRNYEAWETILRIADLVYSHRKEDTLEGRKLAERALDLDENYASAWTWMGWSHLQEVLNGWAEEPEKSLSLAHRAADRACGIDKTNPETFSLISFVQLLRRNFDQADEYSRKSVALGPNNPFVFAMAANVGHYCGNPRDTIPLLERAMRLCPIYPAWYSEALGVTHLLLNNLEDAIAAAREAVSIDPDYFYSYLVFAIGYAELGRQAEAASAVKNILRVQPDYSVRTFSQTQPFRDEGVLYRFRDSLRNAGLPD